MEPTAIYATREGNLGGETVEMTVDSASMAHVMSILTDLYSDPVLAVVREYSTNAYDSHVEAGVSKPIEVSLPNSMSPFFKVRDYGVGLSVEDIRNIYSKYGASTKRSTNEQVGMLGLGCKSALTYTQQFTVRSVKDGMLSHVAISRTENGSGVMQVVATQPSDEPNGVEISIPVDRIGSFDHTARDFFRFWEPGTVLLDGVDPSGIEGIKITDDITVVKDMSNDYVVMGNVAYRVSDGYRLFRSESYYGRSFGIVAKVAIGSVNFTPSREDLHYTDHTKHTLDQLRVVVEAALIASIQKEIDAQPDHKSALKEWNEWQRLTGLSRNKVTYKDEPIPAELKQQHIRYRVDYGRGAISKWHEIAFREIGRFVFVYGYPNDDVSTSHRAKMRLWADQNGFGGTSFIITKDQVEEKWFTSKKAVSWTEVFATKKPREERDGNEAFSVLKDDSRYAEFMTLDSMDKSKTFIVWTSGNERHEDVISKAIRLHGNALGVKLGKNRWDKFLRENSNAVLLESALADMTQKAYDGLTDDEKFALQINSYDRSNFFYLDPSRLDDPELSRYTRIIQTSSTTQAMNRFRTLQDYCRLLRIPRFEQAELESPREKYPLLAAVNSFDELTLDHFYTYANNLYKESA